MAQRTEGRSKAAAQGRGSGVDRRGFLRGAGLGLGTAALAAATGADQALAATADEAVQDGAGYRETDHVRQVYATARL